jgi:hypothetical protein
MGLAARRIVLVGEELHTVLAVLRIVREVEPHTVQRAARHIDLVVVLHTDHAPARHIVLVEEPHTVQQAARHTGLEAARHIVLVVEENHIVLVAERRIARGAARRNLAEVEGIPTFGLEVGRGSLEVVDRRVAGRVAVLVYECQLSCQGN